MTSTKSSAFTSSKPLITSKPLTPTSAPVKSLSKFKSAKPEPASYYDLRFFLQGTPLVVIIVVLITGVIIGIVSTLGIVKLVNLYRKKVASGI